jgi:ferric-dicitrate binding protein FerR (iron transport regulator)
MRALRARAARCDRAREWISLHLDGELSEFERIVLEAHVARCSECREFRVELQGISLDLRQAPLERLGRPVELPRRTRLTARTLQFAAAAAAAVAVGAGSSLGVITADRSSGGSFGPTLRPAYLDSSDYEMRIIRRNLSVKLLAAISRAN